ncbi:MAG: PadR family transcriptional regulator [Actinomycetales bacterium]|nr:PadR family transcriptional regulator [Actinomycetales bacterium]
MRDTDNTRRPGEGPRYRPEPWSQAGESPARPWAGRAGRGRRGGQGFSQNDGATPGEGRGRGDREDSSGPSGHSGPGAHGGHSGPGAHGGHSGPRGRGGHVPPGSHGPHGRGRGRGRGRGDVRAAILLLLDEQPRHGYELIQEITDRSAGMWHPSPGSVYPTLQSLEDEGLITIDTVDGRRTASLTEAGAQWVEERRESLGAPWESAGDVGPDLAIRREILALRDAATQVVRVGTATQLTAATDVLATARKELYRILAES